MRIIVFLMFTFLFACSEDKKSPLDTEQSQAQIAQAISEPGSWKFKVHVHYDVRAEPYTGSVYQNQNNLWDISTASLVSLFQFIQGRTVEVPQSLNQMKQITPQLNDSWTTSELIEVAEQFAEPLLGNFLINAYVIYLEGTFKGDLSILGTHLKGKNYIFIFKDAVKAINGTDEERKIAEQATILKQLGHMMGLVNQGIPQVTNHEDDNHPGHSIQRDCVMYHAIGDPNQILNFLSDEITNKELNFYGAEVTADISNF